MSPVTFVTKRRHSQSYMGVLLLGGRLLEFGLSIAETAELVCSL